MDKTKINAFINIGFLSVLEYKKGIINRIVLSEKINL